MAKMLKNMASTASEDYEIDRLTVNLMQTNRLRWLVEDLRAELACYNTRELDYETARKVKKYLNYVESMRVGIGEIFVAAKANIVSRMKRNENDEKRIH